MLIKLFKVSLPLFLIIIGFVFPWFNEKHTVATMMFWYPCAFLALVLYLSNFKAIWNSSDK